MKKEQRGSEYGVHHGEMSASLSLREYVSEALAIEEPRLEELLWLGAIYLNQQRFRGDSSHQLRLGDYLRIHTSPRRYKLPAISAAELIVCENEEFVVVNKPAGLPVHAIVDNCQENLISFFKEKLNLDLYVTSRLDIPTSGLIVYAKTARFQKAFNECIRKGEVKKFYLAICKEKAPSKLPEVLVHYMQPSMKAPKVVRKENSEGALECVLRVLEQESLSGDLVKFSLQLITGRTHQIRAQLSYEGFSILGDGLYGSDFVSKRGFEEIALQSSHLSFGSFKFEAPSRVVSSNFISR